MAYYRDLARCTYFAPECDDALVAVGWLEPGHDFHRGLLTRSSSSAWSPSQTGLGGRFFISAVRNVVSVSIEGRSSRPTCSSHTVGALSRRRKASRTTSRHIGISRQTSSSWPSPLVQRCAVQSTVEPSRRTAVDSLHKPSTHIGTMSSEIHYLLQNPAPSAAAYFEMTKVHSHRQSSCGESGPWCRGPPSGSL